MGFLRMLPVGGCHLMKFSPAGNWLAAVDGNGKDIVVFDIMHMKQRGILDGHLFDVADLCWSEDGIRLVSISDQDLYVWSMDSMQK